MTGDSGSQALLLTSACIAMVLLIALCFFFSLCSSAITASNIGTLKQLSENGNKNAKFAVKIKNKNIKYLHSAQTGTTLNAAAAVILSEQAFFNPLYSVFFHLCENIFFSMLLSVLTIFLVDCIILLTFGQLLPQKISLEKPEQTLIRCAKAFVVISAVISPLSAVCSGLTNIILKLSGSGSGKNTHTATEEKILMMVDEGEENGSIEENTKSMIENVFDFDDTTVGEIMTHRRDIVAVKEDARIVDIAGTAIKSGRSRIPVYSDDIDSITGIIYVKDLLKFVSTNVPTQTIDKSIIHKAVFVPESKRCSEMFEYMTSHKTQIAVVVDEFGGTGGIITMEDLIESIVGNIQDEYDNEDEEIRRVDDSSFFVDGSMPLDEISDITGIDFDDNQNDTIAGLMLDKMGHIPKSGEHPSIMIKGTRFTVSEIENRRISKVLIVKKNKNKSENT